jgi:hypothetical protein
MKLNQLKYTMPSLLMRTIHEQVQVLFSPYVYLYTSRNTATVNIKALSGHADTSVSLSLLLTTLTLKVTYNTES